MKKRYAHVVIVTDCGGSDRGRYEIALHRCFYPHDHHLSFFETESMNTLHAGFTAAAHALSSIDHFGPLRNAEQTGVIVNAAPRHGNENGRKLRGAGRNPQGEEIYALRLKNDVWVVGPNAGYNFYFLRGQVVESFLVTDMSGRYTPFRSMEVMVPVLAKIFGIQKFPHLKLKPQALSVPTVERCVVVADSDSHGNIYLASTMPHDVWMPPLGESNAFMIGNQIARPRHVDGIFAGETGEQTLTRGSLTLNGEPVYYIVIVGSNAHRSLGSPPVGTKVEIEQE